MSEDTPNLSLEPTDSTPPKKKVARKRTRSVAKETKPAADTVDLDLPVASAPAEPPPADAPSETAPPADQSEKAEPREELPSDLVDDRPEAAGLEAPRRVSSRRISSRPRAANSEPKPAAESRETGKDDSPKAEASADARDEQSVIGEPAASESQGGNKRRRRRRKKGSEGESAEGGQIAASVSRPKLDSDQVSKKAWRIYLSEVSEEGLALINDQDARELSRRSFRMAEIFLEEEARRH